MSIRVITPPSAANLPISLSLFKEHINVLPSESEYDNVSKLYIQSAADEFEAQTGRALLTQTVEQSFDKFPCEDYFLLERTEIQGSTPALLTFQYRDTVGAWKTFSSDNYEIIKSETCSVIRLKYGKTWPTDAHQKSVKGVKLSYVCGYGADYQAVPAKAQLPIAMIAADTFVNREDYQAVPGLVVAKVGWDSVRLMSKLKTNFYEHKSQNLWPPSVR